MKPIELNIFSSVQERMEVAKILVRNGYRVCQLAKKVGNAKKTVLVVDDPESRTIDK